MAWVAHDLGFLSGGTYSIALAASSNGAVIVGQGDTGSSSFSSHAFRWTSGGGMVDLGLLPGGTFSIATGVSADGAVVVGQADDAFGFPKPFMWTSGGGMVALPLLGTGDQGVAYAVSADGTTIVGFSDILPSPTASTDPFRWTSGGGTTDLGVLSGNAVGIGTAVSSNGTAVVGGTNSVNDLPWRWTSGGGLVALPMASGEGQGGAQGLSADGLSATGYNTTVPGGDQHAFHWTVGGGSILIGALPAADFSVGYGISADGLIIVGDSAADGNHKAFYWTSGGGFVALPELSGGSNSIAFGISSDGLIPVGRSVVGAQHAVYWLFEAPGTLLADMFLTSTGAFVDLTVEANRRKFISVTGGARNLGLTGQFPFGITPPVFLTRRGAPDTFAANNGRGGPFIVSGGTLAAGATDPTGSTTSSSTFTLPSSGRGVLGDYRNGNLYAFNPATLTDNGTSRRWLRRWRALSTDTIQAVKFSWLNITMETGAGVPEGTKPQVLLRWSDDGGHTFGPERIIPVGAKGATKFTVKANRLGMTRRFSGSDRIYELSSTDSFVVSILDANLEAS